MEGLAETIGVVAEVGFEGIGQRVTFCLEQKADTAVLSQHLIDDRGCAVGRKEQREKRRLFRRCFECVLTVDGVCRQGCLILRL